MDQQELSRARRALHVEQTRVRDVTAQVEGGAWEVRLPPTAVDELLALGHFQQYETELSWTPRQVVGHLRDSAQIFTGRVQELQTGRVPLLADFVTDEPARLQNYACVMPDILLAELEVAQRQLRDALAGVAVLQLACTGRHELDGVVTLADVITFLPGHQRDHAEQLTRLVP
jgi:hypothetical protein